MVSSSALSGARVLKLKEGLIAKISQKIGKPFSQLPQEGQFFLLNAVDKMLASGHLKAQDIARIATEFKALFPENNNAGRQDREAAFCSAATPDPMPTLPPLDPKKFTVQRASSEAPTPSVATSVRLSVSKRLDKLVADEKWAEQVKLEAKKFEESQRKEREARQAKLEQQNHVLHDQIIQQQRVKEEQREKDEQLMGSLRRAREEEAKRELELQEQRKKQFNEEKMRREEQMKLRDVYLTRQREQAKREEREYNERIQAELQRESELEKKKKLEARETFLKFVEANKAELARKKEVKEVQREEDRQMMAEYAKILEGLEKASKGERERTSKHGLAQQMKQNIIYQRFLEMEHEKAKELQEREEANRRALEEHNRALAEEEERRRARQKELKQEFVSALNTQVQFKKEKQRTEEEETHRFRQIQDAELRAGQAVEFGSKIEEKERQKKLIKALEMQVEENRMKGRKELQIKVWEK